jgi:hypothetical protein
LIALGGTSVEAKQEEPVSHVNIVLGEEKIEEDSFEEYETCEEEDRT